MSNPITKNPHLDNAFANLNTHHHSCLIYKNKDEQISTSISFIRQGLLRGEKCIYTADENTIDNVLFGLKKNAPNIERALKEKAFSILTKEEIYLKPGFFDPSTINSRLRKAVTNAKKNGFKALRISGDMIWTREDIEGIELLLIFESMLNQFISKNDLVSMCQYDFNTFRPEIIKDLIHTHPIIIFNNTFCRNHYYIPPKEFIASNQPSKEVKRLLSKIHSNQISRSTLEKNKTKLQKINSKLEGQSSKQKREKELSDALNNINKAITSTLDFEKIMQRVIILATEAISTEASSILLKENEHWLAKYQYKMPKRLANARFSSKNATINELTAKLKEPIVVNDSIKDKRISAYMVEKIGVRSILTVPLMIKGDVIGTICFIHRFKAAPFDNQQIDFADKVATSVSLALENAHLYKSEQYIADTLQDALLALPKKVKGADFGHVYHSATDIAKVGGDFFDLFYVNRTKMGIIIGDVSGKGIGAANLASTVKSTIKAYVYEELNPAAVLKKANNAIIRQTCPEIFVTLIFAILDIKTGEIILCNAGHPHPIIKSATKTFSLEDNSIAVGISENQQYENIKIILNKGDILVFFTDGTTESRKGKVQFSRQRLFNLIAGLKKPKTKELPKTIFKRVSEFASNIIKDDLVILTLSLK